MVPVTTGVTAGPVVKHRLPLITVPADVLTRVVETTPNGASVPRFGAVAAVTPKETDIIATNARPALNAIVGTYLA